MAQHTFYERAVDETVIVPTEAAAAMMLLYKGQHLTSPEQALRAIGIPFLRLFELFSPTEIDESIAGEKGRDLVMVSVKGKREETGPGGNGMKKLIFCLLVIGLVTFPAAAATDMFGATGITSAASSTCPAGVPGFCSSGWFRLSGAMTAAVQVTASAGTNTVLLEHRFDSTGPTSTIYTWTNAGPTTVGRAIVPPVGEFRLRATALSGGTLKGKITAAKSDGTNLF